MSEQAQSQEGAAPPATSQPKSRTGLTRLPETGANVPGLQTSAADALVTRGGRLHRAFRRVELRLSQKQIYTVDGGRSWQIQGEGYDAVNAVAGAKFILSQTVPVDGIERVNPYVVRGDAGEIKDVYIRGAIIARAENGNVVPMTQILNFSPGDYFRSELVKICKMQTTWGDDGRPQAAKDWGDAGRLVPIAKYRDEAALPDDHVLYPIDDTVGALIDLRSTKIGEILQSRSDHLKFATRRATTMLLRRLAAKHPGLPSQTIPRESVTVFYAHKNRDGVVDKVYEEPKQGKYDRIHDAVATVPVLGWIELEEDERGALQTLARQLQEGEEVAGLMSLGETSAHADEGPETSPAPQSGPETIDTVAAAAGDDQLADRVTSLVAELTAAGVDEAQITKAFDAHLFHPHLDLAKQPADQLEALAGELESIKREGTR